jgi:hypothetical protein
MHDLLAAGVRAARGRVAPYAVGGEELDALRGAIADAQPGDVILMMCKQYRGALAILGVSLDGGRPQRLLRRDARLVRVGMDAS